MSMKVKVKIENLGREIEMEVGDDLRSALLENDVQLYADNFLAEHVLNCHGKGLCTTCRVEVVENEEAVSDQGPLERLRIGSKQRLACQMRVYQDITIRTVNESARVRYTT